MRPAAIVASALYGVTLGLDVVLVILGAQTADIPLGEGQPPLLLQLPFFVPILLAYSTLLTS